MPSLLIIEDEERLSANIARYLERHGWQVARAATAEAGLERAAVSPPDAIVLDFNLPGMDGLAALSRLRDCAPESRVVMLTGEASVPLAVDAMKAGAADFVAKPFALAQLRSLLEGHLEAARPVTKTVPRVREVVGLDSLLGASVQMVELRGRIRRVAALEPVGRSFPPSVLISGETGSGKELVAMACHAASPRAAGPFIEINCAALPATLLESELFGYERGAFTDARERKAGLFEAANRGTLFLDEVGEIDVSIQAKLLKVLDEHRIRRLGGLAEIDVDVRVIAATNQPLQQRVRDGLFRADLLHRLNVIGISVPALRERTGDIVLLARHFLEGISHRYGRDGLAFSPDALRMLVGYGWPGNVRQLRNAIEEAVLVAEGGTIEPGDISLPLVSLWAVSGVPLSGEQDIPLSQVEREAFLQALQRSGWNVSQAARQLQVSRATLRYRMRKLGIAEEGE